ncbi:SDR family NAD(P)-dependent oxidoreductase [Streptomyces chartreusis]|uniref:SDR family NAD(P)-dependent oxidoreductase n=1 Tax=Streptomyces chartreusis TaxID=1969 RepID=UPI0038184B87
MKIPQRLDIAVVGVGALLPGAPDAGSFWRNVVAGRDLIRSIPPTRWRTEDYFDPDPAAEDKTYARWGAFLDPVDFDPVAFGVPPNVVPATDIAQLLALLTAQQTLNDATAGDLSRIDGERTGVIIGSGGLELYSHMAARMQRPVWLRALRQSGMGEADAEAVCDRIAAQYLPWQEATFPGALSNVVAGRIANRFDLHGATCTTDAACASSLAALSAAVAELTTGRADLMLTGGVDTLNDITMYMCFSKTPALSRSGDCRPFSDHADGTVLGEGLVMFALKRLTDAEQDGNHIYAVIRGIGASSDGSATAIYAPLPAGQVRAMRRAYDQAGYHPGTVELVEAHGTGTPAGDLAEFTSLRQLFSEARDDRQWCALGSVKSQIGHTKSAAGAAGLLKAVFALHHKTLPPTIKVQKANPRLQLEDSPFYLNTRPRPWIRDRSHPRRASVSAFGFGGSNFHVTVEEYIAADSVTSPAAARLRAVPSELVVLSASSPEQLRDRIDDVLESQHSFTERAWTSQQRFSPQDAARLCVVAPDASALNDLLRGAAQRIAAAPQSSFTTPGGLRYTLGEAASTPPALLFAGQGGQYPGMGADLAVHLPQARAVWDQAASWRDPEQTPVHRVALPPPALTEDAAAQAVHLLNATEWAQPALATLCLSQLAVLRAAGLEPAYAAGHSFGELVALHTAGCFDAEQLLLLAQRRGELLRDAGTRPAGMLAVHASAQRVNEVMAGLIHQDVWVSAYNAPEQVVVSGIAEAVAEAEAAFERAGIPTHRLRTSGAFHTPLVASAADRLSDFLAEVPLKAPGIDVYSNVDAMPHTAPPDIRLRLVRHLTEPVRFADTVNALYDRGVRTFVEIGAGNTLCGLVADTLGRRTHLAVSMDRAHTDGFSQFQQALGALAVEGRRVNFAALWPDPLPSSRTSQNRSTGMTIPLHGPRNGRADSPRAAASQQPSELGSTDTSEESLPARGQHRGAVSCASQPWFHAFEQIQERTAEAHTAFQRSMADAHIAFLRTAEASLTHLKSVLPDAMTRENPALREAATEAPYAGVRVDTSSTSGSPALAEETPLNGLDSAQAAVTIAPGSVQAAMAETSLPAFETMAAPPRSTPAADITAASLEKELTSIVAELTGYPPEMLDPAMDLVTDLGIDSIKRVQIMAKLRERHDQLPEVPVNEFSVLRSQRAIVTRLLEGDSQDTGPPGSLTRLLVQPRATGPVGLAVPGLFGQDVHLVPDTHGVAQELATELNAHGVRTHISDNPPADATAVIFLRGLDTATSVDHALSVQHTAFRLARLVAAAMERAGRLFITVQDTGGDFGARLTTRAQATVGGLAALARTAAQEWPRATVRAIDCERGGRDARQVAQAIAAELLEGGCASTVALAADGRRAVPQAQLAALSALPRPAKLNEESLVAVTGGGRGITAQCVIALARAYRPRFLLLGRTPLLREPTGLRQASDLTAVMRALREPDPSLTAAPRLAELTVQARQILAARQIHRTLSEVRAAGAQARYADVDVRDAASLRALLDQVRGQWGPVTAIVHGAGTIADARIANKTDAQFASVLNTKVRGLHALLDATAEDPLALVCLFSSIAAHGGNAGQSDYAMANEILHHTASVIAAERPGCAVRALGWGAWQGGMVTADLEEHLRAQGMPLIPPAAGASAFVTEIASAFRAADVHPRVLLVARPDAAVLPHARQFPSQAVARVSRVSHPQLADHSIGKTPVIPMAYAIEWFARMVSSDHGVGPLRLCDIQVLQRAEASLHEDDCLDWTVISHPHTEGSTHKRRLKLTGSQGQVHYRAEAFLDAPDAEADAAPRGVEKTGVGGSDAVASPSPLYDGTVLFHGPRFQAIHSLASLTSHSATAVLVGVGELGWPPEHWVTDVAAVDGGVQTAVVWAAHVLKRATLPMSLAECRVHRRGALPNTPGQRWRCSVRARDHDRMQALCDVTLSDGQGVRIELIGLRLFVRPDVEE